MSDTPMRDRFSHDEITVALLKELDRYGPGGLIFANRSEDRYDTTHARSVDWTRPKVVIYGRGDLAHDLDFYDGDWQEIAAGLTGNAHDEIDRWTEQTMATSALVRTLREDMRCHGMYLDHRPRYGLTDDGGIRTDDTFALRGEPRITFTACCVQHRPASLLASLDMYDQGHFVTTWTQRVTHTAPPRFVREAPLRAQLYLDLRP
ncbi:hypothetical protein HNR06_000909 [Nocardiopsis arvandica]|uniref:Uncharacterized protein n=1 Tax=Nocardiopsis sinuspersici TaxID=501010 RepID=A0A7Y9XBN9_9ACTN|nr:hypothetical protein [Nocardiopsis sinuspersici]